MSQEKTDPNQLKRTINFDDDQSQTINVDKWPDMNLAQLQSQLTILDTRLRSASNINNPVIGQQLQAGINKLQLFITIKYEARDKNITNKGFIMS